MIIEPSYIEAEVYFYDHTKERFFVKITFVGMGMYINSFSIQASKFENQEYWVQPPKHRQGKGWTPTVDFDKGYQLWHIIEKKAVEAVKYYLSDEAKEPTKDRVYPVLDEPISLDNIVL